MPVLSQRWVRARIYRLVIHGTWCGLNSRWFFVGLFSVDRTRTHSLCVCVCLSCAHMYTHQYSIYAHTVEPNNTASNMHASNGYAQQMTSMPMPRVSLTAHRRHSQEAMSEWHNSIYSISRRHTQTHSHCTRRISRPGRHFAWSMKTFWKVLYGNILSLTNAIVEIQLKQKVTSP